MTIRHTILGLVAALIWAAAFIVSAEALKTTPPLFLAALRFSAASAFILFVPRPKVSWFKLMLAGLLLGALQYGLLFIGMRNGVAPGIASLLVHAQVFFTMAFAFALFQERLNGLQVAGVVVAVIGLTALASQHGSGINPFGLALVIGAAVAGGAGNIVLKRIGSSDRVGIAVWMSLAPPLPLFLASALLEQNLVMSLLDVNWVTIGAVAYTAVLSTVAAFAIWALLFSTYPASAVGALQLLVPVFGIALSISLLGEQFTPLKFAATAMIFGGLILISPLASRIMTLSFTRTQPIKR